MVFRYSVKELLAKNSDALAMKYIVNISTTHSNKRFWFPSSSEISIIYVILIDIVCQMKQIIIWYYTLPLRVGCVCDIIYYWPFKDN